MEVLSGDVAWKTAMLSALVPRVTQQGRQDGSDSATMQPVFCSVIRWRTTFSVVRATEGVTTSVGGRVAEPHLSLVCRQRSPHPALPDLARDKRTLGTPRLTNSGWKT